LLPGEASAAVAAMCVPLETGDCCRAEAACASDARDASGKLREGPAVCVAGELTDAGAMLTKERAAGAGRLALTREPERCDGAAARAGDGAAVSMCVDGEEMFCRSG
jgi:hypothetical protein